MQNMVKIPLKDIIEWDVDNWGVLVKLWTPLIDSLAPGSNILAVGERNGGLSAWLASKGHKVWCTDRIFPTDKAKNIHQEYGVSGHIVYAGYDVVAGDENFAGKFDLVIAKSVIGGLKQVYSDRSTRNFAVQQKAVGNIYKTLKPGGYFLSAENMEGSLAVRWIRKIKGKDKGWRYLKWKELPLLFGDFRITSATAFGVVPGIAHNRSAGRLIYLINNYVLRFLPPPYKCIGFVTAQKA